VSSTDGLISVVVTKLSTPQAGSHSIDSYTKGSISQNFNSQVSEDMTPTATTMITASVSIPGLTSVSASISQSGPTNTADTYIGAANMLSCNKKYGFALLSFLLILA
jgi:predicted extracellular nuclease